MAKMFYTMEEAKVALGRTEDEIKQLSREGKLREFRDGPRLMFKADQVEALKGALPSKDTISIEDSGAPIGLADSKNASGGGIPLTGSASGVSIKDDTSVGDIGLSGSQGGVPSPRSGSRSGSGTGMNIFAPDDADSADPSAATQLTPQSDSGSLEAVGSGSGLLDLTRESDDTSLGAVLDEITPQGKRDPNASKVGTGTAVAIPAVGAGVVSASAPRQAPVVVYKPDAMAPMFGGLAAGGAVIAAFALFVLASAVTGAKTPALVETVAQQGMLVIAGAGLVLALILGGIGFGLGKVLK